MHIIRKAHSYDRTPPSLLNLICDRSNLQRWFLSRLAEPTAECPAEGFYSLDGCYLFNGKYALCADGDWLPDTILDHAFPGDVLPRMQRVISGHHYKTEIFDDAIHTVVIYKSGSANYGHFLTDVAPKVANIARAGYRRVRYLVPDDAGWSWPILHEISRVFGVSAERCDCTRRPLSAVSGANFYTPVSRHNDGPRKSHALLDMRRALLDAYGSRHPPNRRLYVDRSAQYKRTVINGPEICALFAAAGFEAIAPEQLPFEEQVRLFSGASHIAGPLGAAMANMIFAPPSCEVLIIDPGLADCYFWDLACLVGQRFHFLFVGRCDHYSPERAEKSFHVDPDSVRATLRMLDWPIRRERRLLSLAQAP